MLYALNFAHQIDHEICFWTREDEIIRALEPKIFSRNQARKSTLVKHILSYLRIMAEAEEVIDYQEEEYYEGEEYLEGEEGQQAQGEAVDPELMKKRVAEMEEELDQLTKVQLQVEKQISSASDSLDENSM